MPLVDYSTSLTLTARANSGQTLGDTSGESIPERPGKPGSRIEMAERRREEGRERTILWRARLKAHRMALLVRSPRLRKKREYIPAQPPGGYAERVKADGLEAILWLVSHNPVLIAQGLIERARSRPPEWWWQHREASIAT